MPSEGRRAESSHAVAMWHVRGPGAEGSALVTSILDDYESHDCEPDAREVALIRAAAEVRDRLGELQAQIDAEEVTVTAGAGAKAHSLLVAARGGPSALRSSRPTARRDPYRRHGREEPGEGAGRSHQRQTGLPLYEDPDD